MILKKVSLLVFLMYEVVKQLQSIEILERQFFKVIHSVSDLLACQLGPQKCYPTYSGANISKIEAIFIMTELKTLASK